MTSKCSIPFQIKIPNRRKSTILQSFENYQKEEARKENTPKTDPPSPFSNNDLNTPLLQRIAKKLFNDNNLPTPIQKVTRKDDISDNDISLSYADKNETLNTSTPKVPTKRTSRALAQTPAIQNPTKTNKQELQLQTPAKTNKPAELQSQTPEQTNKPLTKGNTRASNQTPEDTNKSLTKRNTRAAVQTPEVTNRPNKEPKSSKQTKEPLAKRKDRALTQTPEQTKRKTRSSTQTPDKTNKQSKTPAKTPGQTNKQTRASTKKNACPTTTKVSKPLIRGKYVSSCMISNNFKKAILLYVYYMGGIDL